MSHPMAQARYTFTHSSESDCEQMYHSFCIREGLPPILRWICVGRLFTFSYRSSSYCLCGTVRHHCFGYISNAELLALLLSEDVQTFLISISRDAYTCLRRVWEWRNYRKKIEKSKNDSSIYTMNRHYIIWIDEAGRGAWAGPIVAWGFMMEKTFLETIWDTLPGIRDSKKLSKKERENIFSTIEYLTHKHECQFTFAYRDAEDIDMLWIRESNRHCMEDIILSFLQFIDDTDTVEIWIDGCDNYTFAVDDFEYFFAKKKKRWNKNWWYTKLITWKSVHMGAWGEGTVWTVMNNSTKNSEASTEWVWLPTNSFDTFGIKSMDNFHLWKEKTISYLINGDDILPIISLGWIIAKVIRDRMMCEYNEDFPLYHFDEHVGYGTRKHQEALHNYNITPIHRKSYAPVKRLISHVS